MGNCISPFLDSMDSCISKCMPKRGPCSHPIQDKLVVSELPSMTPPTTPPLSTCRKSPFSDEFFIATVKQNFHPNSHLVSVMEPVDASRSKVCTESLNGSERNSHNSTLSHASPLQQLSSKDPENILFSPSCSSRIITRSESNSPRCTTGTSYASNASTNCSRNRNGCNCRRTKEPQRVPVPYSCSNRYGAIARPGTKRWSTVSCQASSSSSNRKTSSRYNSSCSVCASSTCSSGSNTSLVRRKEICRHEVKVEHGKASAVGSREGSSFLKRKKSEKVVHPISHEDDIGDTSCNTAHSVIEIDNLDISLDCFIFV